MNKSRIESVLGTWTIFGNITTDVFDYRAEFYAVAHVTCNTQLSGNRCSLDGCFTYDGDICIKDENSTPYCGDVEEEVVDWSDVVIYYYFGYDCSGPDFQDKQSTVEWIGPYNAFFEQNEIDDSLLDSYSLKYVEAPATPYVRKNKGCEFLSIEDFLLYFGADAVNLTVYTQANNVTIDEVYDPYYKTCENGNVHPILPLFEFDFYPDDNGEYIGVKMDFKMLIIPEEDDELYDVMPKLKKHGFPVDGPYCYDGDSNRGWAIDIEYDSTESNDFFALYHTCVEGLPYMPESIEKCDCYNGDPCVETDSTTVHIGTLFVLVVISIILGALLFFSICANIYYRYHIVKSQYKDCSAEYEKSFEADSVKRELSHQVRSTDNDVGENDLSQPLLITEQNETTKNKNDLS